MNSSEETNNCHALSALELLECESKSDEQNLNENPKTENMTANTKVAMNLSNSIIGVSIMAMPFCMKLCGIVLGSLILLASSILTRFTCYLLLKSAVLSRKKTYEFVALHTFGSVGKLAVEINIIGFMLGILISFFVVIGDLGPVIVSKAFGVENSQTLRTFILLVLGFGIALPLAMLKELDSLSQISTLSIVFYVVLTLTTVAEAFPVALSGSWVDKIRYWEPSGILQSLPIFALALSCQTQIFEIYETLPDPSLKQMNSVIKLAVYLCTGLYTVVGIFGYIACIDQDFTGNILLNFSPGFFTELIKMFFVLSVAMSFPLVILPCRASIHSLLFKRSAMSFDVGRNYIPEARFKFITVGVIVSTLTVGLLCPNIELVLGFVGSTIGVLTCIVFPALLFIQLMPKHTFERWGAMLVLAAGVLLLASCTWVNLNAIDNEHRLAVEKAALLDVKNKNIESALAPAVNSDDRIEATSVKVPKNFESAQQQRTENEGVPVRPSDILGVRKNNLPSVAPAKEAVEKDHNVEVAEIGKTVSDHAERKNNPERPVLVDNNHKRQEPPVPQEPEEGIQAKPVHDDKPIAAKPEERKENEINFEAIKKEDSELENKEANLVNAIVNRDRMVLKKHEEIIRKLEEQQQKLLDQQKEFIEEMKAHERNHEKDEAEAKISPKKSHDSEKGEEKSGKLTEDVKKPKEENGKDDAGPPYNPGTNPDAKREDQVKATEKEGGGERQEKKSDIGVVIRGEADNGATPGDGKKSESLKSAQNRSQIANRATGQAHNANQSNDFHQVPEKIVPHQPLQGPNPVRKALLPEKPIPKLPVQETGKSKGVLEDRSLPGFQAAHEHKKNQVASAPKQFEENGPTLGESLPKSPAVETKDSDNVEGKGVGRDLKQKRENLVNVVAGESVSAPEQPMDGSLSGPQDVKSGDAAVRGDNIIG